MTALRTLLKLALVSSLSLSANQVFADTVNITFAEYPVTGSIENTANSYFSSNFGVTIENGRIREFPFESSLEDGWEIANGSTSGASGEQIGKINFINGANAATIYVRADGFSTFSAFSQSGSLIQSYELTPGIAPNPTFNFFENGSLIAYITFTGQSGAAVIKELNYRYDPIIDPPNEVPAPAALPLMATALAGLGFAKRRNKK